MRALVLSLGIAFVVIFVLLFLLVNYNTIYKWDESAFLLINSTFNVSYLNGFFAALSIYGREYFWVPVVILLWLLGKENGKKTALMMVIVFVLVIIIGFALKDVYYRPRPFLSIVNAIVLVPKDFDSSFPSGHALVVAAGATVAFLMLKKRYSIPLLIEAALVIYSRVYVGVHYPTDVVAGLFLGAAIALITYALLVDSRVFRTISEALISIYSKVISTVRLKRI